MDAWSKCERFGKENEMWRGRKLMCALWANNHFIGNLCVFYFLMVLYEGGDKNLMVEKYRDVDNAYLEMIWHWCNESWFDLWTNFITKEPIGVSILCLHITPSFLEVDI